jgi:hypothetical protein
MHELFFYPDNIYRSFFQIFVALLMTTAHESRRKAFLFFRFTENRHGFPFFPAHESRRTVFRLSSYPDFWRDEMLLHT